MTGRTLIAGDSGKGKGTGAMDTGVWGRVCKAGLMDVLFASALDGIALLRSMLSRNLLADSAATSCDLGHCASRMTSPDPPEVILFIADKADVFSLPLSSEMRGS